MASKYISRIRKKLREYPEVLETVTLFLLVGVIYFGVKGGMILAFRSTSPMMGVTSDSMTHPTPVWRDYYDNASELPFQDGVQPGDLVIVKGVDSLEDIRVGDVIVWVRNDNKRIIHRVDHKAEDESGIYIKTRSDHYANYGTDDQKIRSQDVVGKAVFSVPYLGYPSTLI